MEATITTQFDLKDCVYTVKNRVVIFGEIYRISAEISHILERSEWKYYYDLQTGENSGLYNVPEKFLFRTREEAEELIKQGW